MVTPVTPQPESIQGAGRILLVEDEPLMLSTAQAVLENLGYSVQTAVNGAIALDLYKAAPHAFDLVLLDMIMPVMSGRECFEAMLKVNPQVRVVLSSGFTQEEDLDEMKKQGLRGFIGKPYRRDVLSQTIHQALHEHTQDSTPTSA